MRWSDSLSVKLQWPQTGIIGTEANLEVMFQAVKVLHIVHRLLVHTCNVASRVVSSPVRTSHAVITV